MTLEELREWLSGQGFYFGKQAMRLYTNSCDWYAWRRTKLDARECESNEAKTQIVITPFSYKHDGKTWESVEVDLTGEASSIWWKLSAYSLSPAELKEKLPEIEKSLVSAWNGLTVGRMAKGE